jgi:hypothetical protein
MFQNCEADGCTETLTGPDRLTGIPRTGGWVTKLVHWWQNPDDEYDWDEKWDTLCPAHADQAYEAWAAGYVAGFSREPWPDALAEANALNIESGTGAGIEACVATALVLHAAAWENHIQLVEIRAGQVPGAIDKLGDGGAIAILPARARHETTTEVAAVLEVLRQGSAAQWHTWSAQVRRILQNNYRPRDF